MTYIFTISRYAIIKVSNLFIECICILRTILLVSRTVLKVYLIKMLNFILLCARCLLRNFIQGRNYVRFNVGSSTTGWKNKIDRCGGHSVKLMEHKSGWSIFFYLRTSTYISLTKFSRSSDSDIGFLLGDNRRDVKLSLYLNNRNRWYRMNKNYDFRLFVLFLSNCTVKE